MSPTSRATTEPPTGARRGTQAIERSIRLLRTIATRPRFGWALSDLARACEIDKGTARRMLFCLVNERLVERSESGNHYLPGPLLFELGLALPRHDEFKNAALPLLKRLAGQTRGVAFLSLRSGDEVTCAALVGNVPGNAFTMSVGTRRPMSNTAAGVALLLAMPVRERQAVFSRNSRVLARSGIPEAMQQRVLRKSLEMGMGWNEGWFGPNWNSYALPLMKGSEAWASVMIAGTSDLFTNSRRDGALTALRNTTQQLQQMSDAIFSGAEAPAQPAVARITGP